MFEEARSISSGPVGDVPDFVPVRPFPLFQDRSRQAGELLPAEQIVVSGNREIKSWVALLSIKVAVVTVSSMLSLPSYCLACLGDISVGGTRPEPLVVLLSAPQAA